MSSYFASDRLRFLGHRGAAAHRPENTLASFEEAARFVDYIETDCWMSRDGAIVLHHDESLERTCGVTKSVRELDLRELKELDAGTRFTSDGGQSFPWRARGTRIPTLKESLEAFPKHFFNIEIKDDSPGAIEAVLAVLKETKSEDRVLLAAEKDPIMHGIRKLAPDMPTSGCFGELFAFLTWLKGGCQGEYHSPARAFQIPDVWNGTSLATPQLIHVAQQLGKEVHYWTINDPKRVAELLAIGANGIVTDRPELASSFTK